MQRLVCIVEGQGDVQAVPRLCARVLNALGASGWYVDEDPIRRPRSQLVDERVASPSRPCREEGLRKALAIAEARRPAAILVLCDSDDDCPGVWASSIEALEGRPLPRAAVMAVREFEGWLLWTFDEADLTRIKATNPERVRDAKGKLERLVPGYMPTLHQQQLIQRVNVGRLRRLSRSFDKLVRTLSLICKVEASARERDG